MENSEEIKKIIKYLESQPKETVYRLCANLMIDIRRWDALDRLKQEKISLLIRSKSNSEQLCSFLKQEGTEEPLTIRLLPENE